MKTIKRNWALLVVVLVLGLKYGTAQETYQYKAFGMTTTYEFAEDSLKVFNHKGESETVGITLIEKSEVMSIYTSDAIRGKRTKYTLVKRGKKGKYVMLMDIVDDFTKEVTQFNLFVKKVAR